MPDSSTLLALLRGRAGSDRRARPGGALHRRAEHRPRAARRGRLRARRRGRRARPRHRCRDRPLVAPRLVGDRVHRRQVRGRGVPDRARALHAPAPPREEPAAKCRGSARLRRRFWQGVVVNMLNPKTALFFFAFLPQFVDPDKGSAALQIGVLGLVFVVLAVAQRQRLGARCRHRLRAAAGQPALPRGAALRLRLGVRRPRRADGASQRGTSALLALTAQARTLRG